MGVKHLPKITEQLIGYGRSADTPVAMIQQGTTEQQRIITGTLATIADIAQAAGIRPPAITVVGEVAALANEINWFDPQMLIKDPISEFLINRQQNKADVTTTNNQLLPSPLEGGD